jgi:uncharacterized protein (TIGR00369 family)
MEEADFAEDLRMRMRASGFHRLIGVQLDDARPGEVDVSLEIQPQHLNLQGLLHGGLIATLADIAMGLAVRTKLEPGARHVTVALDMQYLSAARNGRVSAQGRVVRAGRQIAQADADVLDAQGKLLARARSTVAIMADRAPSVEPGSDQ